jgi:hypothetical protein
MNFLKAFLKTSLAAILLALAPLGSTSATTYGYLPGQIVCTTDTHACYMIYLASNHTTYKKYIGQPDVLAYYNPAGKASSIANVASSTLAAYPTYNYTLGLPTGTIVGDKHNGKLYAMQPVSPDGDSGNGPGNFSYSNTFPAYIPTITDTWKSIVTKDHIKWVSAVDNVLGNTIDGDKLPSGTIVKQTGLSSFFRITGDLETGGMNHPGKSYIGTPELLDMWLERTGFYIEADVSGYGFNDQRLGIPPGIFARTTNEPYVVFAGDDGYQRSLTCIEDFVALGASSNNIRFVEQTIMYTAPTYVLL